MTTDNVWHFQELRSESCLQVTMGLAATAAGPHWGRRADPPHQPRAAGAGCAGLAARSGGFNSPLLASGTKEPLAPRLGGELGSGSSATLGSHTHFNPHFRTEMLSPILV